MKSLGKIVHLSSVHHAKDNRIFHKECKSLALAGYDVTLIAVSDHDFTEDSVKVRGVPKFKNRTKRIFMAPWRVYQMALEEKADLYHFHDSELIPIGLLLRLRGYKVVYDVHENLSQTIKDKVWIYPWLRTFISTAVNVIEKTASLYFNGIVVANPFTMEAFHRVSHKTINVNNFPQLKEIVAVNIYDANDIPQNIVYIGVISQDRGAVEMVSAMGLLDDDSPIHLLLGGNIYPHSLEDQLRTEQGFGHTTFLGWLSRNQVIETLRNSFVGLCILHSTPNYLLNYPTKLFEYMGVGMPVIGNQFEIVREIIETHQCGLMVPEKNPQAITDAIQWLFDHPQEAIEMGRRGRQAIETQYNWESEMTKLLSLYNRILQ